MCRFAPMAPFKTVGMALQMAATKVMRMASVLFESAICSVRIWFQTYAVRPTVKIEAGADHPLTVTRSENQYRTKAIPSQVLRSTGTGS